MNNDFEKEMDEKTKLGKVVFIGDCSLGFYFHFEYLEDLADCLGEALNAFSSVSEGRDFAKNPINDRAREDASKLKARLEKHRRWKDQSAAGAEDASKEKKQNPL